MSPINQNDSKGGSSKKDFRALGDNPLPFVKLITCEHGGNQIPQEILPNFPGPLKRFLNTHRGYDIGALSLAQNLASELQIPIKASEVTRLVVDLNRSAKKDSKEFQKTIKPFIQVMSEDKFLGRYYWPYRMAVEEKLTQLLLDKNPLVHLSIHSFTPELRGVKRKAVVGILHDPSRVMERNFSCLLQDSLLRNEPPLVASKFGSKPGALGARGVTKASIKSVRLNYPYLGTSDGFTTHLRTIFPEDRYAGIEIEFNQAWLRSDEDQKLIFDWFLKSLRDLYRR